jgi:uncharacterized membrane protein
VAIPGYRHARGDAVLAPGITGSSNSLSFLDSCDRADVPEWVQSHYQFQIRTFWIRMLYAFISVLTMLILVGWMLALFTVVWLIVRCAKGMKQIASGAAYPNVTTWLW